MFVTMKKSQQQQRRESSVLSGGSEPNSTRVVGQSSMNLRSLEEGLPANNNTRRYVSCLQNASIALFCKYFGGYVLNGSLKVAQLTMDTL